MSGKKSAVIVLNGEKPANFDTADLAGKYVICADGAYDFLAEKNIAPDMLVGDFDSLSAVPQNIPLLRYPAHKDKTDGELALLHARDTGAEEVLFLCAAGGRDDHAYANLMLLYTAHKAGIRACMKTETCAIYFFEKEFALTAEKNRYLSIVPFSDTLHILNTEGLQYPITDRTLYREETLGVSNITSGGKTVIRAGGGLGLVFYTAETADTRHL